METPHSHLPRSVASLPRFEPLCWKILATPVTVPKSEHNDFFTLHLKYIQYIRFVNVQYRNSNL